MRAIFIVGTGRSGTHFIARLLAGFANVRDPLAGKEDQKLLDRVSNAALLHKTFPQDNLTYYQRRLAATDGVFIDQHHPNLFFIDEITRLGEGLVFLYPDRPPEQIVASMLRHKGVQSWYGKFRLRTTLGMRAPMPNRFLGITNRRDLSRLPRHQLYALRIAAHRSSFLRFKDQFGASVRSIDYEALVGSAPDEFARVFSTGELEALGPWTQAETPRAESLDKWRDVLTPSDVEEIRRIVDGDSPSPDHALA